MQFNSLQFLIFFPVVVLLYFAIPKKIRYVWLLIASYYFYMCWNARYALLLLFSTAITYLSGIFISLANKKTQPARHDSGWKKLPVALSVISNLSVLFFFKYFEFFFYNVNSLFLRLGIELNHPEFDVLLPVGISFYTFQALGYTIDVYRNTIPAEKNFFRYALFVSFFPQLVAGPIERSKNLLTQIHETTHFQVENARYGLLTMAYGLILKIVIADRIALIIDPILSDFNDYKGMRSAVCIVLFAFQIYCDFHGYTQIAIGSARILGFHLQENFNAPYLATNVKDFWRRWHISLTSWFTDYLYIPLGGNRKGKARKYINTMIVFLCSGLWHGASWAYVVWGGLNGLYLIGYDLLSPLLQRLTTRLKIDTVSAGWKLFSGMITFLFIDYAWIYFRMKGLKDALRLQIKILQEFHLPYLLSNDMLMMFNNYQTLCILILAFFFLFLTDYLHNKGIDWKEKILQQQLVWRWLTYFTMLFVILLFGVYGTGNEQTQFIYFQF